MASLFPDTPLVREFRANQLRAVADANAEGVPLGIRSWYRTAGEQAAIRRRKNADGTGGGKRVAQRHSMHEDALAVDFSGGPRAIAWMAANAPRYGMVQAPWPGGSQADPVHFEPIGARGPRPPAPSGVSTAAPMPAPPAQAAPPPLADPLAGWNPTPAPAPRFYLAGGPNDPRADLFAAQMRGMG